MNNLKFHYIIITNRNRDTNFLQSRTVYEESNFTLTFLLEKHLFNTDIFKPRLRLDRRGEAYYNVCSFLEWYQNYFYSLK